jgi:squalene/oxidosqualene cyclase-like protein
VSSSQEGSGASLRERIRLGIRKQIQFLKSTQAEDGTWPVHYGGPSFLLPLYVIAAYISRHGLDGPVRAGMVRQIHEIQLEDGSIGLHFESRHGMMFTTVICYVALRLLGEGPDQPRVVRMRQWIRQNGGPLHSASWGKFILCLLGLYEYRGVAPIPPELYLLPGWLPFHPRKLSGYVRIIYLPMSYFYATRAHAPMDPLLSALREELYDQPYDSIAFEKYRWTRYPADNLVPEHPLLRLSLWSVRVLERLIPAGLRRKALARVHEHVIYEDETSAYIRQAPVNALYNTLVHYFEGDEERVQRSWEVLPRYLWDDGERINMQGFTSTKLWDNTFFLQGLQEADCSDESMDLVEKAYDYVRDHQVTEELPDYATYHRLPRKGGWTFSEKKNAWTITDCTAEAIKAILQWEGKVKTPVTHEHLEDAVGYLLFYQNEDGGWGSCDRMCSGTWLELFNAANVFFDIMVDHSFAECTSSCLEALIRFRARYPDIRAGEIGQAISKGVGYLLRTQRSDGSWEACWGICFTYGTAFAVQALAEAGYREDHPAVKRACDFLLERQLPDGGWGEEPETCIERRYISTEVGTVEQTAWAVLALQAGGQGESEAVRRGLEFLLATQQEDGDWPPQPICGLFYRTTLISYENYKRAFPLLALARASRRLAA